MTIELPGVDDLGSLAAENTRLRQQLARTKSKDFCFLGEVIPIEVLGELIGGGKLTAKGAQTRGLGMHGDGGNLWLQVTSGGRSWLFRYRWGLRQREMGLGSLGEVSLAEARGRASICRRLVRNGVDPIERRRALGSSTSSAASRSTFKEAAERYFEAKRAGWRSRKHSDQFKASMRDYVYGVIGNLPVQDVDTDQVLQILEPIWTTKPETASRVRARIEQVLDWAAARKMRASDNPARWRGHLQALLPARSKVRAVVHHAALPFDQMNEFWQQLAARDSASAEALRFTILTAARTGEVIGAKWNEIDLDAHVWVVPAGRMKAHRQHRVALSSAAIAVLTRLKPLKASEDGHVFPGAKKGSTLSNMAMAMALRKLGRADLTVHGFRSSFRDWAAEATAYPNEMVEMALAHVIGNKAEAAYRRGDMFERRRRLMEDWAAHCTTVPAGKDTAENGGNVVMIGSGL